MTDRTFGILYKLVIVVLAVLAALAASSVILLLIGANPFVTFYKMIFEPLTKIGHIREVLIRAVPLCLMALGVSIASRSGITNIGGEGQMYLGLIAYTGIALFIPLPKPLSLIIGFLFAALAGAFWGFIPGILKAKLKVSELLSTVMLNYIAAQMYTLCLRTVYLDPGDTGTPMSARLDKSYWLERISGPVHTGLILALVLAVLVWLLMFKTTTGYKLRAAGSGARAARYGGINVAMYVTLAMAISGAFAGLAGAVELAGVHRRAIEGITNNYGFSGVVVALFGGLHPFGIIPASFFFGLLIYGSTFAATQLSVPANIVQVMQGITIIVIVTMQMVLGNTYLQDRVRRRFIGGAK